MLCQYGGGLISDGMSIKIGETAPAGAGTGETDCRTSDIGHWLAMTAILGAGSE